MRVMWLLSCLLIVGGCRTAALLTVEEVIEPLPDLASPDLDTAPRPERNSCGGTAVLAHEQGTSCGPCGYWICAGVNADAVRCSDPEPQNACGTCGPAPIEICNGFDDDCDGLVDPGCPRVIAETPGQWEDRVRLAAGYVALETHPQNVMTPHTTRLVKLPPLQSGKPLEVQEVLSIEADHADLSESYFVVAGALRAYDLALGEWIDYPDTSYVVRSPVLVEQEVVFVRDNELRSWAIGAATTQLIATFPSDGAPTEVAVHGKWLAYVTPENGGGVHLFDRGSKTTLALSMGLDGASSQVALGGHRVAWTNTIAATSPDEDPTSTVYVYDVITQQRERIAQDQLAAPRLSRDGDLLCGHTAVFWQDTATYVHNFANGTTTLQAQIGQYCDLDGARLAWVDASWPFDARYVELAEGTF